MQHGTTMLFLGSCGLHVNNGSLTTGHKAVNWKVQVETKSFFKLFKDSPARQANYIDFTGCNQFPKKFCSVRWVENVELSERALEVIKHINLTFTKRKNEKMKRFLKRDLMDKATTPQQLSKLDVNSKESLKEQKKVDVGTEAKSFLSKASESANEKLVFRKERRDFLVPTVAKIFDWNKERLDVFYHKATGSKEEFKEIWSVFPIVFILSHGNARVESGFSVNADMLVENLKKESLIARRKVYDSIVASGGALNVNITSGKLTYARQSHSRYQECLKQKREKATNEEKKAKERKRAAEQTKELEEKRSKIKETLQQELTYIERVISELEVSRK